MSCGRDSRPFVRRREVCRWNASVKHRKVDDIRIYIYIYIERERIEGGRYAELGRSGLHRARGIQYGLRRLPFRVLALASGRLESVTVEEYSLWGSNPRPMAHKTIALTTELRERVIVLLSRASCCGAGQRRGPACGDDHLAHAARRVGDKWHRHAAEGVTWGHLRRVT
jgi:hypothetical protein